MKKQIVCKTVVPYPEKTRFVLCYDDGGFSLHPTIEGMAAHLRLTMRGEPSEFLFIKNEVPGDIIWKRDDTLKDTTWECERLEKHELHQLALLLKE